MTKKDYKLIAVAVGQACDERGHSPDYRLGISTVLSLLIDALQRDNPSFDTAEFERVCYGRS